MEALKSESFVPMSYGSYIVREWIPGMTQRLTFAVAGKTNNFDTKLPLPVLVYTLVILSLLGVVSTAIQIIRKKATWLTAFTLLITLLYAGVLSFQLYGNYVDTAEPVAINGRYLLPLLPLIAVTMIQSMRAVCKPIPSGILASIGLLLLVVLLASGAGVGTYIMQAQSYWFWPGFGQTSHAFLKALFGNFILPYRY